MPVRLIITAQQAYCTLKEGYNGVYWQAINGLNNYPKRHLGVFFTGKWQTSSMSDKRQMAFPVLTSDKWPLLQSFTDRQTHFTAILLTEAKLAYLRQFYWQSQIFNDTDKWGKLLLTTDKAIPPLWPSSWSLLSEKKRP